MQKMKNEVRILLVRNVSKSEMAMLFYPDVCPESALKSFMRLLNNDVELYSRLVKETNYKRNSHRFTPRQQEMIISKLRGSGKTVVMKTSRERFPTLT